MWCAHVLSHLDLSVHPSFPGLDRTGLSSCLFVRPSVFPWTGPDFQVVCLSVHPSFPGPDRTGLSSCLFVRPSVLPWTGPDRMNHMCTFVFAAMCSISAISASPPFRACCNHLLFEDAWPASNDTGIRFEVNHFIRRHSPCSAA